MLFVIFGKVIAPSMILDLNLVRVRLPTCILDQVIGLLDVAVFLLDEVVLPLQPPGI